MMGLRKIYERYGLSDVIEEEVRLINLGLESSLEVIINELCTRSIEKHLNSNLYVADIEVEPTPLHIVIILQGFAKIDPLREKALAIERAERAELVLELVSFMQKDIIDKIIKNGYTPEDIARDYYVRKLGAIGSKLPDEGEEVVPFTANPSLGFYKSITVDFVHSRVTGIQF
jgi:hypothetical protein